MFGIENALGDAGVIAALALIGVLVFAECAFLAGLFVPGGDILLLVSGVFASQGDLPLAGVLIVVFVTAVAGYQVGYIIGEKTGPQIFKQKKGAFFRKEYAERASSFYEHHGGKTVVIARFLGYVRTVAPLLAGIAKMRRGKFIVYNISGAFAWTVLLVMLGYWFGSAFTEQVKSYIMPVTLIGLALLGVVSIYLFIRARQTK